MSDACVLCGTSPARGFASIGDEWYCHGDNDAQPTCYERATHLLIGGVPRSALPELDAVWRESIGRRSGFQAHGTRHTVEGLERRKTRDRARQRARMAVRDLHRDEFDWMLSQLEGESHATYNAALRRVALAYPAEYDAAYAKSLADQGYESESRPCSSVSTAATLAPETSAPGVALTTRELPEPGKGSEMADRTRSNNLSGSR